MKKNPYKYPFIAIEGIDGGGKSILIEGLKEWDKKNEIGAIFTKEPTGGEIGLKIRKILRNNGCDDDGYKVSAEDLQKLYIWDRLGHRQNEAAFLGQYSIFSDRDFPSTTSYFRAAGGDSRWVLSAHEIILGEYFFAPDLVIILDLSAEEALERMKKAGKETDYFEKINALKKTRDGYLDFPRLIDEIYPNAELSCAVIGASQPPEKVLKDSLFWIDKCFREKLKTAEYIKIFKGGK